MSSPIFLLSERDIGQDEVSNGKEQGNDSPLTFVDGGKVGTSMSMLQPCWMSWYVVFAVLTLGVYHMLLMCIYSNEVSR